MRAVFVTGLLLLGSLSALGPGFDANAQAGPLPATYQPIARTQPLQEAISLATPFGGGYLKGCPAIDGDFEACRTVNLATGEFVGRVVLFENAATRGIPMGIVATYRSQIAYDGPLGHQWDHTFNKHLRALPNGDVVRDEGHGRVDVYSYNALSGTFTPPPGFYDTLTRTGSTGWVIRDAHGNTETYNAAGKLTRMADRNGNAWSFAYAGGRLAGITDAHERVSSISYHPHGRISTISDFMGRQTSFSYDSQGNLASIKTPATTDFPAGKTTSFTYDANHNLISAKDPATNVYLTNFYSNDQVISQSFGPCGQHGFQYNTLLGSTTATDANGNAVVWTFGTPLTVVPTSQTILTNRHVQAADPAAFTYLYQHNADGEVTRIISPQLDMKEYVYQGGAATSPARGNMLQSIHRPSPDGASSNPLIRSFTYEPQFNQVKTATSPRGNDPTYIPTNGGAHSAERYTYTYYFDFEEASLGDLNGDGVTDRAAGNVVAVVHPEVNAAGAPAGMTSLAANMEITERFQYNLYGQPTRYVDPNGKVATFTYFPSNGIPQDATDLEGFLMARTTDVSGTPSVEHYVYDPAGNVISYTDGNGATHQFAVNQRNQVTQYTGPAPSSHVVQYKYDANDNVAERRTLNQAPDADGNVNIVSAHPYYVDTFEYNAYDMPTAVTMDAWRPDVGITTSQPMLQRSEFAYDCNLNCILTMTPTFTLGLDGLAFTSHVFDERDLLASTTIGGTTPLFRSLVVGNRDANVLEAPGSSDGSTTSFTYDGNGNLRSITDPRGNSILYVNDGFGRPSQETNAAGNKMVTTHNPDGQVTSRKLYGSLGGEAPLAPVAIPATQLLEATTFLHDEAGRLFQTQRRIFDPAVGPTASDTYATTTVQRDPNGNEVRRVDPNGNVETIVYDGQNRPTKVTDALGNEVQSQYDSAGNLVLRTRVERDPSLVLPAETYQERLVYDEMNRLVRRTDSAGHTERMAYDSHGRRAWTSDAEGTLGPDPLSLFPGLINVNGNTARTVYDGIGRAWRDEVHLRAGGDGSGAITDIYAVIREWNPNNLVVRSVDPRGSQATYEYDSHDRLTQANNPDGTTQSFTYDPAGNVASYTDQRGVVVTNIYDVANRPVVRAIATSEGVGGTTLQKFAYNGRGQATLTLDNNDPQNPLDDVLVTTTYDSLGRPASETQAGREVKLAYDLAGSLTHVVYPNGATRSATYDALRRAEEISFGGTLLENRYFGPSRTLDRLFANGWHHELGYDAATRLQSTEYSAPAVGTVAGYQRSLGRENQVQVRESLHDTDTSATSTFDSLYRPLTSKRGVLVGGAITSPSPDFPDQATWDYDELSNWNSKITVEGTVATTEARTHDSVGEIIERTIDGQGIPLSWDAAGNLATESGLEFVWDFSNRLVRVESSSGIVAAYTYDADGRRMSKTVDGQQTTFSYHGRELIQQDFAGGLHQQYVYDDNGNIVTIHTDTNSDGDALGTGDSAAYVAVDETSSPVAVGSESGTILATYHYDGDGTSYITTPGANGVINHGGDDVTTLRTSGGLNPFGTRGSWFDDETGLLQLRSGAFYSPELGRAISRPGLGITPYQAFASAMDTYVWSDPVDESHGEGGVACCGHSDRDSAACEGGGSTGHGSSECTDPDSNGMKSCNSYSGCGGGYDTECVQRHEDVHRADRGSCCDNVRKCKESGRHTDAECEQAYADWKSKGNDWTECNAYRESEACAGEGWYGECCNADGSQVSKETNKNCCDNNRPEGGGTCECWAEFEKTNKDRANARCASGQAAPPCTLGTNGDPTPPPGGSPTPPPPSPWYCSFVDKLGTFDKEAMPALVIAHGGFKAPNIGFKDAGIWSMPYPSLTFGSPPNFVL